MFHEEQGPPLAGTCPRAQMGRKRPKRGKLDQEFGRGATVQGIAAVFSGTISVNNVPFGMQRHRRRVETWSKPRPPDFCDTPVLIPRIMDEWANAFQQAPRNTRASSVEWRIMCPLQHCIQPEPIPPRTQYGLWMASMLFGLHLPEDGGWHGELQRWLPVRTRTESTLVQGNPRIITMDRGKCCQR
jgi:hypothetical protein